MAVRFFFLERLVRRDSRSHAKLFFAFGHAHAYLSAFAYLVPKKRYQRFS